MLDTKEILDLIKSSFCSILKDNLVGIYVHGSLSMNCFNPDTSDIDFLVVVKQILDFRVKRELIETLLMLSDKGPKKGFEMSILLEEDVKHFKYPTPFILHYSNAHKEKYQNDHNYMCEDGEDPDLAAHITVTIHRGICIFGEPINKVFDPVPKKYYIESIMYDIANAREEILVSPVYIILNLCRVSYYLKEGVICSKKEGGEWAYLNVPSTYTKIIKAALSAYKNAGSINLNSELLFGFADFMINEINKSNN